MLMERSFKSNHAGLTCICCDTDDIDGSDEDAGTGDYYEAKASKKKEKRRQEREAQRQAKTETAFII